MKSLFISIVLFANFNAYCHCQSKVECAFIDEAIHCDEFAKRFSVNKYESSSLIIVDENRYIDSCYFSPIDKREIHISREQKYKFDNVSSKDAQNVIVLHKIDKLGKGYRFHFWRPTNNTMLVLESIKNKRGISITVISSGSY